MEVRVSPDGPSGFTSYWLTAKDADNNVLWKGMVLGKEQVNPPVLASAPHREGQTALQIPGMPRSLYDALVAVPEYHMHWEPAWEVVVPKQLKAGNDQDQEA